MGAESTYWRCSCGFKGDIDAAADHVLGAAGEHELVADGALQSPAAVEATVYVTPTSVTMTTARRLA